MDTVNFSSRHNSFVINEDLSILIQDRDDSKQSIALDTKEFLLLKEKFEELRLKKEKEPVVDEHFCDNCDEYTNHKCRYSTHERDSTSDHFECLVCHWYYSGYDGKYHPP